MGEVMGEVMVVDGGGERWSGDNRTEANKERRQ